MTEEQKSVSRLDRLEQRTFHMDGEMTAMKQQVSSVSDAVVRIEQKLDSRTPVWNTNTVLTLVVIVGSFMIGALAYLEQQLGPIREEVEKQGEFRHQMHYEVGVMQHSFTVNDDKWNHFDELHHQQDDKINELQKQSAGTSQRLDHMAEVQQRNVEIVKGISGFNR